MNQEVFTCSSCGAPVILKRNAAVLNCPYCGAFVVVPKELRETSQATNWSTLIYDGFISNHNEWMIGSQNSEYFDPLNRVIEQGRYRWEAQTDRASSITTVWLRGYPVSDFHLIVNCKHILGSRAGSSWGVVFRVQDNDHYYHFHITDERFFSVSLKDGSQWDMIADWATTTAVKPNGVNQLEVIAYEKRFTFLINGQLVCELDDDHFSAGLVGLAIEGYTPGEFITFDFMDLTLRAPH